jgi:hypothetical protein
VFEKVNALFAALLLPKTNLREFREVLSTLETYAIISLEFKKTKKKFIKSL